ncbi:MAG: hypothetical protein KAI64_05125, partial [Thermoplasmata archaeon]|nr:hypothetical protein [Thermoplasmata archaeon]
CDSSALACKEQPTVSLPVEVPWTLIAGVVIVAALVVVALVVYMKKFKGKGGRSSPASALEAVKQDLGQQSE